VACVIAALSLNAVLSVRDEIGRYEQEVFAHHTIIGRALRPAILGIWSSDGRERALALIRDADQRLRRVEIRWVWLDANDPTFRPRAARAALDGVARGEDASIVDRSRGLIISYVPADPPGPDARAGAIEIVQTLDRENEVRGAAMRQAAIVVVGVTLLSALATSIFGAWFVGRPMKGFIEQARRIGRGDLSYRIFVRQRDEFGELADEMNRMCESLVESQDLARGATDAKLRAIEQLRHADRLATVGRLAAGMAHELGTPLNVVSARAKPIGQGKVVGDGAKDNARIIVEQVERMAKIMRQLLDFARKRELSRTTSDLVAAVRRVVTFVEPIAKKAGVAVEVEGPDAPLDANVDPAQMDQVVTNLVINAIHASPRGSAVTVSVARERAASPADGHPDPIPCTVVRVVDRGSGIAPEHMAQLFEPFFTTKEIGEGTGLGLSVAYGIVKDHGGWIDVSSVQGSGATFSVWIPEENV
jgi:signal transduction histidine kinase